VDDKNTWFYFVAWGDENCIDTDEWRAFNHAVVGKDLNADYSTKRTLDNDFLQDRDAMAAGNFTGVPGIPNQDIMMWVSMGAWPERQEDHLGASDLAVVEFRKLMVEAVKAFKDGSQPAIGTTQSVIPHRDIQSWQGIVTKDANWTQFGVGDIEAEALGHAKTEAS
jgi:phthalate 4,5-dioxygenase oxygenase subunit